MNSIAEDSISQATGVTPELIQGWSLNKTHDIVALLGWCIDYDTGFTDILEKSAVLNEYVMLRTQGVQQAISHENGCHSHESGNPF